MIKHIGNIFRADWQRLTASVVAVVVMLGLCLVPCLYAWFNILSNWDPYGPASTGNIKVAVASEDEGCEILGLHLNIGELVMEGLQTNDQMGWVFLEDQETALDGVYAGDYYAALVVPEEFTADFVSLLDGELEHPQIQYYENEKKNAIAPKITGKAKTAVQEQINNTIIEKVAGALTTASSVFQALGLDAEDVAARLIEKLQDAQWQMNQLSKILTSLEDVMNNADDLLTAAAITVDDVNGVLVNASDTVGSVGDMITTGSNIADSTASDVVSILNAIDKSLVDLEDKHDRALSALRSVQELLGSGSGKLNGLSSTLDGYAAAMEQSQSTLAAGATLANTVSGYLANMEADVRRITDSSAFREFTDMLENNPDGLADYLASPVQLNTEIAYEIGDYGSAMSPYYIMLALFVGSLLTAVMIKVPVTQPQFLAYRAVERYFGRFVLFFLVGMAQALVTAFGCLYFVGIQCVEPARFVLACCICSLNFAMMNFGLVYALDNVGMAAAVIIMVIQVAGSGGSYPIHVLPMLFQKLYFLMPFHYGMDMIRETIGGMYSHTYRNCALILLGMCVIFTVFGLLVYYPARKLNAAIAESKERSGIM